MPAHDNPLDIYLGRVRDIPPFDREEESECINHMRANDAMAGSSFRRLVEVNLQLLVSIADHRLKDQHNLLHLIEIGNNGLKRAVESLRYCAPESFFRARSHLIRSALFERTASRASERTGNDNAL